MEKSLIMDLIQNDSIKLVNLPIKRAVKTIARIQKAMIIGTYGYFKTWYFPPDEILNLAFPDPIPSIRVSGNEA